MHREEDILRFDDRDRSAHGGDGPATDIVSLPASVQRYFDRADEQLRQNRPAEATSTLQQAGLELARTAPELFALMVASQMGARRLTFEESEMNTRTVRTDRYLLGWRIGHEETTTTEGSTRRRSVGLG